MTVRWQGGQVMVDGLGIRVGRVEPSCNVGETTIRFCGCCLNRHPCCTVLASVNCFEHAEATALLWC